jgi:hypothetical protein
MPKSKEIAKDMAKVRGFYRLQISEEGVVKGDSGWKENQITNGGFDEYIVRSLAGIAGSKQVVFAALGSGTAPASSGTALPGEYTNADFRAAMSVAPTVAGTSNYAQFAFTLDSGIYTGTDLLTIQNVGLFDNSTAQAGQIFAGNIYTTSTLASNQKVEGTYQIRFASA